MKQYRAVAWTLLGLYFCIAGIGGSSVAAFFSMLCGAAAGYSYRKRST